MIQDRLTAKFKNAKPAARITAAPKVTAKAKTTKDPVWDAYARGRRAAGSLFWL